MKIVKYSFVILASFGIFAFGCGSTVQSGGGGSGGTGGSGGGGTSENVCPAMAPNGDEPCTAEGLHCTYGDLARVECRTSATCVNGKFQVVLAKCAVPAQGVCTAMPSAGVECPTTAEGAVCDYPDGTICICSSCSLGPCGAPPPHFSCATPAPDCPTFAPNAGTSCGMEGQSCTYGFPCGPSGVTATCKMGSWFWETAVACPN